jgi:hypothetical protein
MSCVAKKINIALAVSHTVRFLIGVTIIGSIVSSVHADTYVFQNLGVVAQTKLGITGSTYANLLSEQAVVGNDDTGTGLLWDTKRPNNTKVYKLNTALTPNLSGAWLSMSGVSENRANGTAFTSGSHGVIFDISKLNKIKSYELDASSVSLLGSHTETFSSLINEEWVVGGGRGDSAYTVSNVLPWHALAWKIGNLNQIQAIDLHTIALTVLPPTPPFRVYYPGSVAIGLDENEACGHGNNGRVQTPSALYWRLPGDGKPLKVYNLNNVVAATYGLTQTEAYAVQNKRVVGVAYLAQQDYAQVAVAWNVSNPANISFVNLNLSAATTLGGTNVFSIAYDVSKNRVVGSAGNDNLGGYGSEHAVLWNISPFNAPVATDLHPYLGPGFISSYATGVNENGDISGTATDTNYVSHAFLLKRTGND